MLNMATLTAANEHSVHIHINPGLRPLPQVKGCKVQNKLEEQLRQCPLQAPIYASIILSSLRPVHMLRNSKLTYE